MNGTRKATTLVRYYNRLYVPHFLSGICSVPNSNCIVTPLASTEITDFADHALILQIHIPRGCFDICQLREAVVIVADSTILSSSRGVSEGNFIASMCRNDKLPRGCILLVAP